MSSARSRAPTERVRVKRIHERGSYDRAVIDAILDAMPIAHVGYNLGGQPLVTPTLQWREGDHVYWHGSAASRAIETAEETDVCVTVTLIDGIVLARSAFHHSVNYRSVMLLGKAHKITDAVEKEARLKAFMEHLAPGRWDELRPVTAKEMKATTVLSIPISEASAKVRVGPPKDDDEDYALDIWAGVIPIQHTVLPAQPDPLLKAGVPVPDHVQKFRFG